MILPSKQQHLLLANTGNSLNSLNCNWDANFAGTWFLSFRKCKAVPCNLQNRMHLQALYHVVQRVVSGWHSFLLAMLRKVGQYNFWCTGGGKRTLAKAKSRWGWEGIIWKVMVMGESAFFQSVLQIHITFLVDLILKRLIINRIERLGILEWNKSVCGNEEGRRGIQGQHCHLLLGFYRGSVDEVGVIQVYGKS